MTTKGTTTNTSNVSTQTPTFTDIEARLSALEEKAHTPCVDSLEERVVALEAKIDNLIFKLSKKMTL